jgi:hypothetical protein
MSTTEQLEKERALNEFAELIEVHLKKHSTYSFRTANIDGVWVYPVIHSYRKIINFECVNIMCRMKSKNGEPLFEKYSVYYTRYKSIKGAISAVENVVSTYKIFNGDLLSPYDYKLAKLEERFNPYSADQVCCVCYENTMDITLCEHYLCIKCREICLQKDKPDCPICRSSKAVRLYNIDNGLINNNEYAVLKTTLEFERDCVGMRSIEPSPFVVHSYIDRMGSGSRRTMSSESTELTPLDESLEDGEISEISEISEIVVDGSEETLDFIAFDV